MTDAAEIERLRPTAMQMRPVRMDRVFDDPDAVIRLIERRAPYLNAAEFHDMPDTLGGPYTQPRYVARLDDECLLQNVNWIQTARDCYSARIIQPYKCILNINGPMAAGMIHVDLPVYRGFTQDDAPLWLLMTMTYSRLFQDWMVPIASGLAWFYRGTGGAFVHWPDGVDAPPHREEPPMWNSGLMSDNEYMWHAVGATGTESERAALKRGLKHSDRLHHAAGGHWEISDGERVAARLAPEQVRVSLLWKAYAFFDEDHLASFRKPEMNLTIDRIIDIYRADLAGRGVAIPPSRSVFDDPDWRETLEATYRSPFQDKTIEI